MTPRYLWGCLAGLALLAGCAGSGKPPRYVTNFDQVRPGMSMSQVRRLLGWPHLVSIYPDSQTQVSLPDPNDPWAALRQDIDIVFGDGELWQYGRYNLADLEEPPELLAGSPKSYAVWFDNRGHVIRFSRPLYGPYGQLNPSPAASGHGLPAPSPSTGPSSQESTNRGPATRP